MLEHEAQTVLLVKAFEEADPDRILLTDDDRRAASEAAGGDASDPAGGALARASRLLPVLEARLPGASGLLRATRLGAGFAPLVLVAAFVLGLASNALGPARHVSVWQWPFVVLFAWNLVWYAIFVLTPLLGRSRAPGEGGSGLATRAHGVASLAGRGARLAGRAVDWVVGRFLSRARRRDARTAGIAATAVARFAADWRRATAPLLAARVRLLLHAGSLALALGLVVGMYARGLTFRYEAVWESTILDASTYQRMVDALLGPAAAVLGRAVPDIAPYRDPGPAAPWLHLYAMATLLYVAIPRTLFLAREGARVARLSGRVPADLPPGYVRRAGLASAGDGARVLWFGYGCHPAPRAADALTALLHGAFGTRCEVEHAADLAYGAEPGESPAPDRARTLVVLVSLAQTPESEVHGEFLASLVSRGGPMIVIADASPLAARGLEPVRVEERRGLWTRIGREAGVEIVHVDLAAPEGDAAIDRIASAAGSRTP